jgi:GNAT superfamily N-acetyltransferase
MIDQLFTEAAAKTGLNETQVISALAGSLGLMKKHGDPAKVQALFAAVPGTSDLADAGQAAAPKPKGGLFGGLAKAAGGAAAPDALALMDRLKGQGVGGKDLQALLPVARQWVERTTGKDLLGDALKTVPGAGALLGAG